MAGAHGKGRGDREDRQNGGVVSHRNVVFPLVVLALACTRAGGSPLEVRPGIDVLVTDSLQLVTGARVGLLTNHTGIDRDGLSDVERLLAAGVDLTALFSPEHGFRGVLDVPDVHDRVDSATGLPIFSLYGEVRAPTPAMLQMIDVLVIDLQDIGARTYTYISTTLLAVQAAAPTAVRVIVLDRPNPIGGVQVQGPTLDSAHSSFVGMLEVPIRHGLTFGELALWGSRALELGELPTVVPMAGWRRNMWFDETGLPWVPPSPNMPDLESATHYPGLVVFEGTNLSVGRGTPVAFQVLAAPWLDPAAVRSALVPVAGATVSDTTITPLTPTDGKYPGQALPALRFKVVDRDRYDPVKMAVAVLAAVQATHPESFTFRPETFDRLAGTEAVRIGVTRGRSPESIWDAWAPDIARFRAARASVLLYE
jgi:uncharacterized protein YbbC (DUF1343 family)